MRVLLSVVGTRGDVQPVLALALEVRELGHEVRLCVPPNFIEWAQRLGFEAAPVGVEMRAPRPGAPAAAPPPVSDLIADQFEAIGSAAKDCDILLGANAHQYAAPSIAERRGIPYVNALYAPTALPDADNTRLWNQRALERVNAHRERLGLPPIEDVLRSIVTERPWLATDPTLAPQAPGMEGVQTGAWMLEDASPLPAEVERFLAAGEPPVYFGFGSMPVAEGTSALLIAAARAAGRRAIVSRGWGELELAEPAADCISVAEVNHQALFPRVAAVVHHGGAGTTLAAARAGAPQVIVPMYSDQPFWARRVCELDIGTSVPLTDLNPQRLAAALDDAAGASDEARAIAGQIVTNGARAAARRLVGSLG